MAPAASAIPILASPVSQYAVDFLVKISSGLLGISKKFEWHQFTLSGQQLEISYEGKVVHSFQANDVSFSRIGDNGYALEVKGSRQVTLLIPSISRLERFLAILEQAARDPEWSLPKEESLTTLLGVATEIVESEKAIPTEYLVKSELEIPDSIASQ